MREMGRSPSRRSHSHWSWLIIVLALSTLSASARQTGGAPILRYDRPTGFGSGGDDDVNTWISDGLDSVIHVYPFRLFGGDFQVEFRRGLFRDRISPPYREDRLLADPVFTALPVKGAQEAIMVSFPNFNGGARREHLRVAILAHGFVALVDISANSREAYERNWPHLSGLLNSLRVENASRRRGRRRRRSARRQFGLRSPPPTLKP